MLLRMKDICLFVIISIESLHHFCLLPKCIYWTVFKQKCGRVKAKKQQPDAEEGT